MAVVGWLVISLGLIWLALRAARIWLDASQWGWDLAHRLRWSLVGAFVPWRYWWGARVAALSTSEQSDLVAQETARLGLGRPDSERCPLCGTEIEGAWTLDKDRGPTVAPGPIVCARCGFRLDACRHCARFLPGSPAAWGQLRPDTGDITFGRCGHYKTTLPVEEACAPTVARELQKRGIETIRAPLPIPDSFVPPDYCTVFTPHVRRLRASGISWPDARRSALLRLSVVPRAPAPQPERTVGESGEEKWLL